MTLPLDVPVDVAIVGGGPAGAAAASWAARSGLDAVIVDKATFPRDKTCGDGITAGALRELDALGIDIRPVAAPVRRTELTGPYGTHVDLPMEAGLARGAWMCGVMRRVEFDALLLDRAVASGVKVLTATVTDVSPGDDDVTVTVEDRSGSTELQARFVIGADGVYSGVRKAVFGADTERIPGMHALRQYIDTPESDLLSVYFPAELLPGYGWIFPLPGGGVNIGLGVQRAEEDCGAVCREALTNDKGNFALGALGRLYREFLQRPDVVARIGEHDPSTEPEPVRAWPIPSDPDLTSLAGGRVLLAGDAARLVDPMTGEGIGQALVSARLAIESIRAGGDVAGRYRRAVDRELGRDLRFARWLLHIMKRRQGVEWGFKVAAASAWTRRNVARWMYEDYPRAFVFTPDRWRSGVTMRGRGAY